jgi:hypothetical protein
MRIRRSEKALQAKPSFANSKASRRAIICFASAIFANRKSILFREYLSQQHGKPTALASNAIRRYMVRILTLVANRAASLAPRQRNQILISRP